MGALSQLCGNTRTIPVGTSWEPCGKLPTAGSAGNAGRGWGCHGACSGGTVAQHRLDRVRHGRPVLRWRGASPDCGVPAALLRSLRQRRSNRALCVRGSRRKCRRCRRPHASPRASRRPATPAALSPRRAVALAPARRLRLQLQKKAASCSRPEGGGGREQNAVMMAASVGRRRCWPRFFLSRENQAALAMPCCATRALTTLMIWSC